MFEGVDARRKRKLSDEMEGKFVDGTISRRLVSSSSIFNSIDGKKGHSQRAGIIYFAIFIMTPLYRPIDTKISTNILKRILH